MTDPLEQIRNREWFYPYEMPDGTVVPSYHGGELDLIHATRWGMLEQRLKAEHPQGFAGLKAVDLAAHQGWFAHNLARIGLTDVLGIDARARHVEDAGLMAGAQGHDGLEFRQGDVFEIDTEALGTFDVVLMLGLLYHVENPVGALRVARALCSGVCVIETQVAPNLSGMLDYGSYRFVRPMKGAFAIIDEMDDTEGPEASVTGICLVPSLEALVWCMEKVGFRDIEVLPPPADGYEQLVHGKRVMVAARA